MSLSTLHEYEKNAAANIDAVPWLGQLVTYSVSETSIAHDELDTLLGLHGLSAFLPSKPGDSDVFRRVCTAAERKGIATNRADRTINILVRNVGVKDGIVLKKIVAEEIEGGRRMAHEQVYDLTFDQATGVVNARCLIPGYPAADEVAKAIMANYPRERGTVDGGALRRLMRKALLASHAVSVRASGGLYFIMQAEADVVDRLHGFADTLPQVKLYRIPLIDQGEQRAMIAESAEEDTLADIDSTLTDIAKLLERDKVSLAAAQTQLLTFQHLKERAERYADLLSHNLGGVGVRLEVLNGQIGELMRRAS